MWDPVQRTASTYYNSPGRKGPALRVASAGGWAGLVGDGRTFAILPSVCPCLAASWASFDAATTGGRSTSQSLGKWKPDQSPPALRLSCAGGALRCVAAADERRAKRARRGSPKQDSHTYTKSAPRSLPFSPFHLDKPIHCIASSFFPFALDFLVRLSGIPPGRRY